MPDPGPALPHTDLAVFRFKVFKLIVTKPVLILGLGVVEVMNVKSIMKITYYI